MATVTVYTAARMKEIEDSAIIDGNIINDDLILTRYDTAQINAGNVRGPQGIQGPIGQVPEALINGNTYARKDGIWVLARGVEVVTSTTRPDNPTSGMMIYETNTNMPRIWNGTAWVYKGGVILCTSITRPDNPFVGLMIYETNTNKFWIFEGSTATWNLPKNVAGGVLGTPGLRTSDQPGVSNIETDLINLNTTVTVGAGRRVKVSFQAALSRTVVDGYTFLNIKEGATTTFLTFSQIPSHPNIGESISGFVLLSPTAGVHTYKLTLRRSGGTGTVGLVANSLQPATIVAEDIGGV